MTQLNDDEKKDIIRQTIAAFNSRDLDRYYSYHTDYATSWEVYFPEPMLVKKSTDFIRTYWQAFPDARVENKNMWVSNDVIFVENVVSGTFQSEFLGRKPTGRRFVQREAALFELAGNKIKAIRIYLDRKTQEEQLDMINPQ